MFLKRLKIKQVKALQQETKIDKKIWAVEKPLIEAQNTIKQERRELRERLPQLAWSKLFLAFLFINFTVLEIFIGWVTVCSFNLALVSNMPPDFTPLITLTGAVIGQTLAYWIYSAKAKAENIKGGISYELALREQEQEEDSVG